MRDQPGIHDEQRHDLVPLWGDGFVTLGTGRLLTSRRGSRLAGAMGMRTHDPRQESGGEWAVMAVIAVMVVPVVVRG